MTTSDRPRVLLIAEAANPEWPSVPLVGWQIYHAIAGVADVHLATQIRNADAIRRFGLPEHAYTTIDTEPIARRVQKVVELGGLTKGKAYTFGTALGAITYYDFERRLWARFREDLAAKRFDLVHRVTPLSPTVPSIIAPRLARLGVPFVIGPLNGGLPWPPGFGATRRREWELLSYVRDAYRLLPGYRSTRAHAAAIICGSRHTLAQMPPWAADRCVYLPENAVDPTRFARPVSRPIESPLRVVFVGRLVPYKGADMLLEAAAPLLRAGRITLEIIGDGPQMTELRDIARREGIAEAVSLPGWIDHKLLPARLIEHDVLGFPSIREFGGGVVLEAMAVGLVPVVVDYGGPGELATPDTGRLIPMGPRDQIIADLRAALDQLAAYPHAVRAMGQRARRRALALFTWPAKARQILDIYRWAQGRRDRPDFGLPLREPQTTSPEP